MIDLADKDIHERCGARKDGMVDSPNHTAGAMRHWLKLTAVEVDR